MIGRGLRDERVARGWSQRALSRVADVDQAFISRLERGMTRARFDRIARVLYALEWPVKRRTFERNGFGAPPERWTAW